MLSASDGAAHDERHRACVAGEVQRGLAGRVAAADDEHVATRLRPRLDRGGAVEHRGADERREARARRGGGRSRPRRARPRAPARARRPPTSSSKPPSTRRMPDHPAGVREARAEHPRLLVGPLGELGARDAPREAEVVADQRARPGLPADRLALEHERVEPLGCRVHRRREARRPGADDGEVDDAGRAATCRGRTRGRARRRRDRRAPGRRRCARAARPSYSTPADGEHRHRVGRGRLEVVAGHPAAGEAALQHVRARLRVVADHREAAVALARRRLPLAQEVGDRAVERLVGGVHGPHHVVVDLHARHELEHGVGGGPVGPRAPLDHEARVARRGSCAAPRRTRSRGRRPVWRRRRAPGPAPGRPRPRARRSPRPRSPGRRRRRCGSPRRSDAAAARAATRAPPRRRRRRGSLAAEPPMHGHPFDSFAARRRVTPAPPRGECTAAPVQRATLGPRAPSWVFTRGCRGEQTAKHEPRRSGDPHSRPAPARVRQLHAARARRRSVGPCAPPIEQLNLAPVMFELGARPHPPRDLYRAYLAQSDIFVGLYGERYGWVAPGEDESRGWRTSTGSRGPRLPKLVYVKEGGEREPRLVELLDRIRSDDRGVVRVLHRRRAARRARSRRPRHPARRAIHRTHRGPATTAPPMDGTVELPSALTALIGRERELETVVDLLSDDDVRLVTLTGPGGIGKSRLSIDAANRVRDRFPGGVAFVDLAPVHRPGARARGDRERPRHHRHRRRHPRREAPHGGPRPAPAAPARQRGAGRRRRTRHPVRC